MGPIKNLIKSVLLRVFPPLFYLIRALRFRRAVKKCHGSFQATIAKKLYPSSEVVVLSGPFQGMKYLNEIVPGPITAKWLGSYEEQLHQTIEMICKQTYSVIINLGSAEGYYAVGLARMFLSARVYAFDVDLLAGIQVRKLSKLNHVSNISVSGYCTPKKLEALIGQEKSLVVCDIEGDEFTFLNPEKIAGLTKSDLLIEIHQFKDFPVETVKSGMIERFKNTHSVAEIRAAARDFQKYKNMISGKLSDSEISACLNEYRSYPQIWLWLKAN